MTPDTPNTTKEANSTHHPATLRRYQVRPNQIQRPPTTIANTNPGNPVRSLPKNGITPRKAIAKSGIVTPAKQSKIATPNTGKGEPSVHRRTGSRASHVALTCGLR